MLAEIVGLLLLLVPGSLIILLAYIVLGQFDRAGIRLTPFQAAFLLVPVVELLIWLWRIGEARGMGLIKFDAILALFVAFSIGLMAPTKWCAALVRSVSDIRQGNVTTRAIVVVVIVMISAIFLLQEIVALPSVMADMAKAKWNEVPKSEQCFTCGLGFALLAVLSAVGIGTVFWEKPILGNVTTKGVAVVFCLMWSLCWALAFVFALFESIGLVK